MAADKNELAAIPERARALAMSRFEQIRPHLEEGRALLDLCRETGLAYRTARRWRDLYLARGLLGLARSTRSDRRRLRALATDLVKLAEGLALQRPPLGKREIHRRVAEVAVARGDKPPSYRTVVRVVSAISPALATLARDGQKAYGARFDLVHRHEAERPNALWQADHTQLDIWAVQADGKRRRPWLTVIIDDYSRAIAAFLFSFDAPSAIQTSLALRQAIWRKEEASWPIFGVPDVLYSDNGSDFVSNHLQQVAADLKIQLINSLPGQPRGRGKIERIFNTINQGFLEPLPGYIGRGGPRAGVLLALDELDRRFRSFLADYHTRPHSETKEPPGERWRSGAFIPRMAGSLEQLDLLLLTIAKPRVVQRDGVRFQGLRYIDPVLAAYVGESVVIRYDPRDLAEIRLFFERRFLCRAICPELAGETVSLREIVAARRSRTAALKKELHERARVVDELLALRGGMSEAADEPPTPLATPVVDDGRPKLKRYAAD